MNTLLRRSTLVMLTGFGCATVCLGYQQGGGVNQGIAPITAPDLKTAAERETVAREAITTYEAAVKKGELPKRSPELSMWKKRLIEAQHDSGNINPEIAKAYAKELHDAEAQAKQQLDKGQISKLEYLEIKFRAAEADGWIITHATPVQTPFPPGGGGAMGGGGGGFGGGGLGGGGNPPRKAPKQNPLDIPRNKAIEEKLETPLGMNFPNETPLEDVIKYIQNALTGKNDKPLPIFINPVGLQEAEKTLTSPISLDLLDVPLRTTLRLVLQQLDMDYRVREGMIYISSQEQFDEEEGKTKTEDAEQQ